MKLFNNVAVACDHAAYDEKQKLIAHLREEGYQVKDCGCDSSESCHYPIFAHRLCTSIQQGESEIGILICGTGIGMSIAANKHKGIRAAACSEKKLQCRKIVTIQPKCKALCGCRPKGLPV